MYSKRNCQPVILIAMELVILNLSNVRLGYKLKKKSSIEFFSCAVVFIFLLLYRRESITVCGNILKVWKHFQYCYFNKYFINVDIR